MSRYSKRAINRAGRVIIAADSSDAELKDADQKVNYWRSLHREPLQQLFDDLNDLLDSDFEALVVGRIKKYDTIKDKLARDNTPTKLATMYDIAGCRVIVDDLEVLDEVCRLVETLSSCNQKESAEHDYIRQPKPSGYRCRHFIHRYHASDEDVDLWAELQVRTRNEHAWATAVEMYDLATENSRLKFDEIDCPAGAFFQKASQYIEAIEDPDSAVDHSIESLREEIDALERECGVFETLRASSMAASILGDPPSFSPDTYCLVDLNVPEQILTLRQLEPECAADEYFAQEIDQGESHNLVLVRGSSLDQLKDAYPNYFGDMSLFIDLMQGASGATAQ